VHTFEEVFMWLRYEAGVWAGFTFPKISPCDTRYRT